MQKAMRYTIFGACLAICILLAGCGNAEQEETEVIEIVNDAEELNPEQIDACQQMTLFIQEGFRTYGIEGTYQAYFGEIEGEDGKYECEILLEGEGKLWREVVSYTYDEQSGWYSFEGQWEKIFTKDSSRALKKNDSFVERIRENYIYQTQIAKNSDIAVPIHYNSPNGPMEHDERKMVPDSEWMDRYVEQYLYTYYDDRMDIYITIEYPQVWLKDDELEERINAALRDAFFYTYGTEKEWNPGGESYGKINRNYVITREDETYFSMRIFENNYFRGGNHPSKWETGITINMQTGEVLKLWDVIGDDRTLVSLLDTGAFQCLWFWKDGNESDEESGEWWLQNVREEWEYYGSDLLDKMDSDFYLTQDGLGLITSVSRYYTPIEAKFADLGVEFGSEE